MGKYQDYLKSKDWENKKKQAYGKKKKQCVICGSKENLNLHHLNYKNLVDINVIGIDSDLRVFCKRCHSTAHRLIDNGVITFKNDNPRHKFVVTKNRVQLFLGIYGMKITGENIPDSGVIAPPPP